MIKPSLKQYPFYLKSTAILLGLVLLSYSLFTLQGILAPVAFSLIIAILLNPLVNKLENRGVKKIIAISLALLLALLIVAAIFYFISSQIMNFGTDLPQLKIKFNENLSQIQQWLASDLKIPIAKQQKTISDALNSSQALIGKTIGGALGVVAFFVLCTYLRFHDFAVQNFNFKFSS